MIPLGLGTRMRRSQCHARRPKSDHSSHSEVLHAAGPQDSDLPPAVINGLFEALSYWEMLDDAGTAAALEAAVLHLAPKLDLDLASGGRYPGLYQLMAHRSPEMRSLVSPDILRG